MSLPGGGRDDLADQRAPRQGVIDVHQARPVDRLEVAEHLAGVLAVVHALEVGLRARRERDARAVGHHVPDGGAVLAVAGVGRQVVAHPVVEREHPAFDEHVHDRGRHRLGRGVHAERRLRGDRDLLGVRRILGTVAPAVPDRPVQHDLALVPQADLDRRVHARPVPVPCGLPDPLDGRGVDPGVVLSADRRDGVEVGGDPDPSVGGHACFLSQRGGQVVLQRLADGAQAHACSAARHRRRGSNGQGRSRPSPMRCVRWSSRSTPSRSSPRRRSACPPGSR